MKGTEDSAIVAFSDDLTGALGLSILIANENIPTHVYTGNKFDYDVFKELGKAIVVNTNSREISKNEAQASIRETMEHVPSNCIVAKRIDSTLRGHLGAELAVIMQLRPEATAIVVPSHPAIGRYCIGGYQQINGITLERTEVAKDPYWPISTSYVPRYFHSVSSFKSNTVVKHIELDDVNKKPEKWNSLLRENMKPGYILVLDASSEADIAKIAVSVASMNQNPIIVSPGAFISTYLGVKRRGGNHRTVVAGVGSTTELTRTQLKVMEQKYVVKYFEIPISVIENGMVEESIEHFLEHWDSNRTDVLVVRPENKRVDTDLLSNILVAIARAVFLISGFLQYRLGGLILSGGETAKMILDHLDAHSIRPEVEIDPLVVGGIILEGCLKGTKIVTKGGLVGDQSTFLKSLTWFSREDDE